MKNHLDDKTCLRKPAMAPQTSAIIADYCLCTVKASLMLQIFSYSAVVPPMDNGATSLHQCMHQ